MYNLDFTIDDHYNAGRVIHSLQPIGIIRSDHQGIEIQHEIFTTDRRFITCAVCLRRLFIEDILEKRMLNGKY